MKRMLSLGIAAMMVAALAGCSNSSASQSTPPATSATPAPSAEATSSEESKVVRIGAYGAHVPFNYMEGDELVGYEVDIWKEIAERNNLELEYTISSDVAGLFTMLDTGKIDTILCQVSATEERAEKYDFSDPYMYSPGGWFINENSDDVNSIEDLFGKSVGVIAGSVDIDMYNEADPEGKIEQVIYSNTAAAYEDVRLGRLDAVGISIPQGSYLIKNGDVSGLKVSGYNGITETDIFPFLKGTNEDLRQMANDTINDMREDGSLAELSIKWFGADVTEQPEA
ncbi:transporter substrate-binding domain-containing protein [Pseudoflavonifractor sp. MCC625]|uniref:transporter substrate-binding domain-containing protein n=1 Tax=Pseudoflavonifractor sp. MCC625 TaxID=2592647 RepID=UPI001C014DBF|nr:transporter substrate-binding domain-containing protein [Pseudoflavonifractor sp. MCC625]